RFKKSPGSFQSSPLGGEVQDGLQLARDLAIRNAGNLARERYQRTLDELNEHLRDAAKILIDITAAQRNQLDQTITTGQVSKEESKVYGVVNPDEEHVLWPFDGEYWRDELGFYRQVVVSKCGRQRMNSVGKGLTLAFGLCAALLGGPALGAEAEKPAADEKAAPPGGACSAATAT